MKVRLKNDVGVIKEVKVGFSWTTFFFGFFPALFRGDLKWAAIMLVMSIAAAILTFGVCGGLPCFILSFLYNKIYIRELLEKGYRPENEVGQEILQSKGIISV